MDWRATGRLLDFTPPLGLGMLSRARKSLISVLLTAVALFCAVSDAHADDSANPLHPIALDHAGIRALRQIDPTLTGTGVNLAVIARSITYLGDVPQNDYRPDITHSSLRNAKLTFHHQGDLPPGISPHATAVCSILFGSDSQAFHPQLGSFQYQGVIPDADAGIYEFYHFVNSIVIPQTPPDADVITASMGDEFEAWWTRGIEALVEHHGLTVVAAIGNGTNACDPPLYPAASANVIGVGVVDSVDADDLALRLANFTLARPGHSTYGPTGSGRSKPDIVAPGNCLAPDANGPNRYEPTGNWSSFATPVVAGTIGLLVQKAKAEPQLASAVSPLGGNCTIRAILLNSATKLPYWHKGMLTTDDDHIAPLDRIQGAGMVNAQNAYRNLIAGPAKPGIVPATAWDNNRIDADRQNVYRIYLPRPAGKVITATAAWNRHYNSTFPFDSAAGKDTNLRLELWAVDPNNPDRDYLLDYSDSRLDNIEHIYRTTDANYTDYEIIISITDGDEGDSERYGLAWNAGDAPDIDPLSWCDLNSDGIVDKADFVSIVYSSFKSRESDEAYLLGDINTDGAIDINDVQILLEHTDLKADWYVDQQDEAS